jgi:two-component SAPR family response regulator
VYRLAHELVWIDAREFATCVERAEELDATEPAGAARLRERAVRLYQGDYLDNACADWTSTERARLRQMYLRALKKLADFHVARRQLHHAIVLLAKAASIEPFEESLQRKLMQLYAATSDWQGVADQYAHLEELLKQEMGVAPERKTRDLYQCLLAHRDGQTVGSSSPP